ncbi:MAG: hypothetical protein BGO12_09880 [Verrucomicrobia bacterium 61-8]|nr:hypothetical protein [Verrucomicrobiota bacterium]OJU98209.1 MAG: hypothetical protein BGO12_09880 [Verrucomicrobia bacterium 61-8]
MKELLSTSPINPMKTASKIARKSPDESPASNRRRLEKKLKELLSSNSSSSSSFRVIQSLEPHKYPPLPYRRIIE